MALVQILKKCNPLWHIRVNTPEICAGGNFCLTTLVLTFMRKAAVVTSVEMTVQALNYVLSCVQMFEPLRIFTSPIGTLGTCFSLEIRWKKLRHINKNKFSASDIAFLEF